MEIIRYFILKWIKLVNFIINDYNIYEYLKREKYFYYSCHRCGLERIRYQLI